MILEMQFVDSTISLLSIKRMLNASSPGVVTIASFCYTFHIYVYIQVFIHIYTHLYPYLYVSNYIHSSRGIR